MFINSDGTNKQHKEQANLVHSYVFILLHCTYKAITQISGAYSTNNHSFNLFNHITHILITYLKKFNLTAKS